jgi:hypothetical protein
MQKGQKNRLMCVAATGLCGVGLFSSAIASPPISGGKTSLSAIDAARSMTAPSRSFPHQEHLLPTLLDLRPPRDSYPSSMHGGALASESFPSAIHHLDLGKENPDTADRKMFPELRTGNLNFRVMSQTEILARRIHREGLPVVRLWDTKAALLSIGLNQRGKPGLWLTQKIH